MLAFDAGTLIGHLTYRINQSRADPTALVSTAINIGFSTTQLFSIVCLLCRSRNMIRWWLIWPHFTEEKQSTS
jgi:multisubunit Na+/H+ antiporter MnhC subunit